MKWFTCTPMDFGGGEDFFSRDSGLLSRGFREIGVESRAVMVGEPRSGDCEDLIRTNLQHLESADWWSRHQLDGVVLYAWGLGKYRRIAQAIRQAGARVVTSIDASGLISPYTHGRDYIDLNFRKKLAERGWVLGGLHATAMIARNLVPGLLDIPRLKHLTEADLVAMVTPRGVETIKSLAHRFGYPQVADKTVHLPHPQLGLFRYDGTPKEDLVLSVGRWDPSGWFQKNPELLVDAAAGFLSQRTNYRHLIVGGGVESLKPLLEHLEPAIANRIELVSHVEPAELKKLYCRARIGCWSSRHEGQQNTGAQALCCGASVVGTTGMAVNCFEYYASRNSGCQAATNTAESLSQALLSEAEAWDKGDRNPDRISVVWTSEFHSEQVAQKVLDLVHKQVTSRHG